MSGKDLKHYHAVATLERVATSFAGVHHDVGYIWNKTDQHVCSSWALPRQHWNHSVLCDPVSHDTPKCGWRLLLSLSRSAETIPCLGAQTFLGDSHKEVLVTLLVEMVYPSFSTDGWHDRANSHAISKVKPI